MTAVKNELRRLLPLIRHERPLIHHMANDVTLTAVADATAALGAAPIMSRSPDEVSELVKQAAVVVINLGTPSRRTNDARLQAMREASYQKTPVVLDPVGVGGTEHRRELAQTLLKEGPVDIIRGNRGEIVALAGGQGTVRGVDSVELDGARVRETALQLSKQTGAVVAATGRMDVVTNGIDWIELGGGHPMMSRSVGMGCLATSVMGCFRSVTSAFSATNLGLTLLSLAGERAARQSAGTANFRLNILDWLYRFSEAPEAVIGLDERI